VSDADYKLFAERCLKLAEKTKGRPSEERALLEIAWRFAQLALERPTTSKSHADEPKLQQAVKKKKPRAK
jgi:hypothetical protein